jgi:hypothetical protein
MENDIKILIQEVAEVKQKVLKMERYFFWTAVITVLAIALPLIGLLFAIPKFLGTYTEVQSLGF